MLVVNNNCQEKTEIISCLQENNSALIIVDIQEKLIKGIPNKNEILKNIGKIIRVADLFKIKIYFTEQNPAKLGPTVNNMNTHKDLTYEKMSFSCYG